MLRIIKTADITPICLSYALRRARHDKYRRVVLAVGIVVGGNWRTANRATDEDGAERIIRTVENVIEPVVAPDGNVVFAVAVIINRNRNVAAASSKFKTD